MSIAIGYLVVARAPRRHDRDLGLRDPRVVHEPAARSASSASRSSRPSSRSASSSRCSSDGRATASAACTSPTSSAPASAACSRSRSSRGSARRASSCSRRSSSRSSGWRRAAPKSLLFGFARGHERRARSSRCVGAGVLPDVRTEDDEARTRRVRSTPAWGPVFRVDVVQLGADHVELPARARRHVRLRHPAVRRRPGVARRLLREGSALDPVRRARHAAAARADHRLRRRQRDPRVARTSTRRTSKRSS